MPNVRRNVFNAVLVLDLTQSTTLNLIAGTLNAFITRGVPLRFGIVPSVETEEGESAIAMTVIGDVFHGLTYDRPAQRMARLVYYLFKHFDHTKAMGFMSRVSHFSCHILAIKI